MGQKASRTGEVSRRGIAVIWIDNTTNVNRNHRLFVDVPLLGISTENLKDILRKQASAVPIVRPWHVYPSNSPCSEKQQLEEVHLFLGRKRLPDDGNAWKCAKAADKHSIPTVYWVEDPSSFETARDQNNQVRWARDDRELYEIGAPCMYSQISKQRGWEQNSVVQHAWMTRIIVTERDVDIATGLPAPLCRIIVEYYFTERELMHDPMWRFKWTHRLKSNNTEDEALCSIQLELQNDGFFSLTERYDTLKANRTRDGSWFVGPHVDGPHKGLFLFMCVEGDSLMPDKKFSSKDSGIDQPHLICKMSANLRIPLAQRLFDVGTPYLDFAGFSLAFDHSVIPRPLPEKSAIPKESTYAFDPNAGQIFSYPYPYQG